MSSRTLGRAVKQMGLAMAIKVWAERIVCDSLLHVADYHEKVFLAVMQCPLHFEQC